MEISNEDPNFVHFDDGVIKITNRHIILCSYWFPIGPRRRILLSIITGVTGYRNRLLRKTWGIDAGGTWWHLDSSRLGAIENRSAITVSIQGGLCDIGFTPEGGAPPWPWKGCTVFCCGSRMRGNAPQGCSKATTAAMSTS